MAGRREIPAAPFLDVARTSPAAASGSDEEGDEGRRWRGGRVSPPGRLEEATRGGEVFFLATVLYFYLYELE
jgi:hypothetical protein